MLGVWTGIRLVCEALCVWALTNKVWLMRKTSLNVGPSVHTLCLPEFPKYNIQSVTFNITSNTTAERAHPKIHQHPVLHWAPSRTVSAVTPQTLLRNRAEGIRLGPKRPWSESDWATWDQPMESYWAVTHRERCPAVMIIVTSPVSIFTPLRPSFLQTGPLNVSYVSTQPK